MRIGPRIPLMFSSAESYSIFCAARMKKKGPFSRALLFC